MARSSSSSFINTDEMVSQLAEAVAALEAQARPKTKQQQIEESILAELAKLAGDRVTDDSIIQQGTKLILPAAMAPSDAITFLHQHMEQQETKHEFARTFRFRPNDGAAALERALKRVFGTAGIGKATWTFFGKQPPELLTINVGVNDTLQVPWGQLSVPALEGTLTVQAIGHREMGPLSRISVHCPRKFKGHVEGLFQVIEDELKERSIYKGKAIDGQADPEFLDLMGVDPRQVVYSQEVIDQLQANVWSMLSHTDVLRDLGIPRKRAILLEGPYGTGKTLAAYLTAQIATANGWTFVYCRPGKDNLGQVFGMARLYQPAIVFFEDVDVIAGQGDDNVVTKLLDMFDGIASKGTEIVAVLTTNHKERIHRAMIRPGRLDAMIHIGALDEGGVERLIQAIVPEDMLGALDYREIYASMEGFLPAFVREAVDRAMRYAIVRDGGRPKTLETSDFVLAAKGLRPQLDLMQDAGTGQKPEPFGALIRGEVVRALHETPIKDTDGDVVLTLTPSNGHSD